MKILIATGGSDYSFMAIEKACGLVIKPGESEVRIISVYQDLAGSSPEPLEISEDQIDQLENISRVRASEHALRAADIIKSYFPDQEVKITMKAEKGDAKKMILEEAEKWDADVIVVGSVGHNFISRIFLGSVSEAIVKHAKCSVLIIRGDLTS